MTQPHELEKSRRDVLDLSLRNPLLNFRPSKRRGLEVVDELSRETFGILVGSERIMYFLAAPEEQAAPESPDDAPADVAADVPAELLALLARPATDPDSTAARHTDNKLQTALTLARLNLRLRETFRQARLSIEEQGVNILYLALGMLRWYESDSSDTERRAPLVLIPVRLTRSGVRENFKLSWTKDEIEPNLSLEAKLKQDFNVRLPEMPSEDDLDVDDYLARVERAVAAKQPRWSVERNEIHLSFFSFSKLLIYKDLDPASWPEENRPADHPLVQQLFGSGGFADEPSEFGEEGHVNGDLGEAGLHPVVDADSSQTLAVLDTMNGRNLVIQGPPGTGKSQTITNLIGEALARGRTVLFVAEKMAALEVVKRRLDTVASLASSARVRRSSGASGACWTGLWRTECWCGKASCCSWLTPKASSPPAVEVARRQSPRRRASKSSALSQSRIASATQAVRSPPGFSSRNCCASSAGRCPNFRAIC